MPVNMKLVAKGRNEPLVGVRDQVAYSEALAEKFRAELERAGFTAADAAEFAVVKATLQSERAEQQERRDQSKIQGDAEREALTEVKAFKRHLDLAVADLFSRAAFDAALTLPVTRDAFLTGRLGKLARSTPKHLSWLADVRPHVQTIATLLAPYFGGEDPVRRLDAVRAALDAAQASQEVGVASLPAETLDVYEAKGRALLLIERLNRAGKIAFAGNASVAAMFNKDLLLRARRSRKSATDTPAVPAEPAA